MEAVILLAHGAPGSLDEVEDYVLRIRHGRPLEPGLMSVIKERYRLVGGSPLLQWTQKQAAALEKRLQESGNPRKVYIGMRHSAPFIAEAVLEMDADDVRLAVAICMAPQFSSLTIAAYEKALQSAIGVRSVAYKLVRSYAKHPQLIAAFSARLRESLQEHPGASVIFTAHSLPQSVLAAVDPYDFEVKETARLVAKECRVIDWRFAYQSQGMTSEKWLGPTVEMRLSEFAEKGIREVIVQPIGFVCDHVEILYDIDVQHKQEAANRGIQLFRASSLNDSPEFIDLLTQLVSTV